MKIRPSILVGQLALIAVGVYILLGSLSLGMWTSLGPGPGFFPCVLSAFLILLSVIWFIQDRAAKNPTPVAESVDRRQVFAVVISLIILGAVMPFIGFQLGVFLFLMYHLRLRAKTKWISSLVISVCGSFGVFWLFTAGLNVSLPTSNLIPLQMIGL